MNWEVRASIMWTGLVAVIVGLVGPIILSAFSEDVITGWLFSYPLSVVLYIILRKAEFKKHLWERR